MRTLPTPVPTLPCTTRAAAQAHRRECMLEPRKLLAAIGMLQSENERLTRDNLELRANAVSMHDTEVAFDAPFKRKRLVPGTCTD